MKKYGRVMTKKEEANVNKSYGSLSKASVGRENTKRYKPDIRTNYARDRDRIIYSDSFYRLGGKTQVFMSPRNPHISNRMTHTLQVAQIARTIARALDLNEDLVEAIAMGHDVGHPPFGHRGEMVLDRLCREYLGRSFKHHVQSVHMLECVERNGRGLNLSYEVKDGIITHSGEDKGGVLTPSEEVTDWNLAISGEKEIKTNPYTLEGCVVRICDKIAYVGKDIEDAIRAGIIKRGEIPGPCARELGKTNGEIIDALVNDIINNFFEDRKKFKDKGGREPKKTEMRIRISPGLEKALDELIFQFNYESIYMSEVNMRYSEQTEGIIEELFNRYLKEAMGFKLSPDAVPIDWLFDDMSGETAEICMGEIEAVLFKREENWTKWPASPVIMEALEGKDSGLLKDMRLFLIKNEIRQYQGGFSSILYFLRDMDEGYIRTMPSAAIVRDAIISMTDDIALAAFEAMRIPRPVA